jgi:hypothetical protein
MGVHSVLVESPKETDYQEDIQVDGMITLEWILQKYGDRVDWIHVAQDREQWEYLE